MEENSNTINFDMPAEQEVNKEKKSHKAAYAAAATGIAGAAAGASAVAAGAAMFDNTNADEIILTDDALEDVADVASASAPHSFANSNAAADIKADDAIVEAEVELDEIVYDDDQIILTEEPDLALAHAHVVNDDDIQIAYTDIEIIDEPQFESEIDSTDSFDSLSEPEMNFGDDLLADL
ncbi:MAG: hypothetical protein K2N91_06875 [Muribaculaceae bacterium]|nr:hypothetical protein [Muribaculaceae bacterium]